MRTLQVDEDVYLFLLRNTSRFGETESETLRRLLGIQSESVTVSAMSSETPPLGVQKSRELRAFVNGGEFRVAGDVTKRFLAILGKVHEQNSTDFARIREAVSGRNRIYFSKDRGDITAHGSSTMPQQIPGSEYWALTNENVGRKQRMLRQVLAFFEYEPEVIEEAAAAMRSR